MTVERADQAERTLRMEHVFKAPPERVYAAWTDPDQIIRWWGPQGCTIPVHDIDVRVGGAWSTTMAFADGDRWTVQGFYKVLEPPGRLVFSWAWLQEDGPGHETDIEVRFEAVEGGTRLTLVQKIFENSEVCTKHEAGWTSSFQSLTDHLTSTI